jgi:acetyl esterase/lipase
MAAVLAILAKQRGDVRFVHQSLYYPVTDAAQDRSALTTANTAVLRATRASISLTMWMRPAARAL